MRFIPYDSPKYACERIFFVKFIKKIKQPEGQKQVLFCDQKERYESGEITGQPAGPVF